MNMADKTFERRGLGRGLSALMGEIPGGPEQPTADKPRADRSLPVEQIAPNPDQPRRSFDANALEELAASIREKGILQPLIVRPADSGATGYQIVAGERRWRAAQLAQLHEVPVIVRDFTAEEAMEVAIIENIQRDDLNPIEEARGYQSLIDRHSRTQEEMATALGKSRSHIANMLRLLKLPEGVQEMVADGRLTSGHARALITQDDPMSAAQEVLRKGLSVREVEKLNSGKSARKPSANTPGKDADTRMLEGELTAATGLGITIDPDAGGESGTLKIRYKTLEQLDDICRVLSASPRDGSI